MLPPAVRERLRVYFAVISKFPAHKALDPDYEVISVKRVLETLFEVGDVNIGLAIVYIDGRRDAYMKLAALVFANHSNDGKCVAVGCAEKSTGGYEDLCVEHVFERERELGRMK